MNSRIIGVNILVMTLASILAACGSVDDAVTVSFADICAKDDRWITSEGILTLGDKTRCESIGDSEECHVQLNDPDDPSKWVTVTFDVGDKPNQMDDIPDSYTDKDLIIRDNVGKAVGVGDKVRVTGTASNNEKDFACRVWVRRVESIP